jgi:hypothetical protein
MNRIRRIRRSVAVLAGLACAWLGLAAIAPAAFAGILPPYGTGDGSVSAGSGTVPPPAAVTVTRTVIVGGTPGWQIALIAIGAAVFAAASAVLAYRALVGRRHAVTATA